ncbi:MAG: quinohemoprotein amine dehydrogenase maturation protein, partial [Blastocatellales bacterium]
ESECGKEELVSNLTAQGFAQPDVEEAIEELYQSHAIANGNGFPMEVQKPPMPFPLQTLVLNVTNQCNLSCKYGYKFGEDRVATPEGKPKLLTPPDQQ